MPPAASSFSGLRIHPLLLWSSRGRIAELNPSSGFPFSCLLPESEFPQPGDPAVSVRAALHSTLGAGPFGAGPFGEDPQTRGALRVLNRSVRSVGLVPAAPRVPKHPGSVTLTREAISADAVQGGF